MPLLQTIKPQVIQSGNNKQYILFIKHENSINQKITRSYGSRNRGLQASAAGEQL